uniref:EMI domain-containing protein n=2 Tax=Pyxicephalus adspersus TaxID=30357 RepID=A0AAV2ZJH3_PYXAD|nr:TPA: hypothetical protein GDO54_004595 [Pyxicephalus adspersus]
MNLLGLITLVPATLVKPHIYTAGSSRIASTIEVHGISTFAHGLPGHKESIERRDVLHHANRHSPKADLPDSQGTISPPLTGPAKPKKGKWCSVVKSQVVSYVDLCKTEKYVIRSQQPCPIGTPDCHKTMYRLAQKPVYEIKRKFVTSLEWKCCPGYTGSTCEHSDPNSIPIPLGQTSKAEKTQEAPVIAEVTEILQEVESQESMLEDIQNDIHQATNHLMELQNALGQNVTTAFTKSINETDTPEEKEIDDRLLREVFLPHVENFLKAHFNPVWNTFNKSLQNLNSMVKNLSENVESNKKRLDTFLENTVPKQDLYELGTKFESKIQENVDKLEQLKHEMANHFHTQQAVIHYNFTMLKTDTDMKLKRNLKMQHTQYSYLNFSISELRRGQEEIQDHLLDLSQNITLQCAPREAEVVTVTSPQINDTLGVHEREIQDLLTEQDVIFENISTLEKWIKELRTEFKKTSESVQVQFMEKSLILEESKVSIQRQIMELNYTILGVQERIEDVKQKEGSSKISLQHSVEDLSLELQLNRQALTAQHEQGRKLMHITTQLQSQATNISDDVKFLRSENDQIDNRIKHLDSSFSSLLEDAKIHENVLEALVGEEVLDLFSKDNPEVLDISIAKIYESLNINIERIDSHQVTIDSIIDRLNFLEMQLQKDNSPVTATIFNVEQHTHMEPSHEASKDTDEPEHSDVIILKKDIKNLSDKVIRLESYCTEGHINSNHTTEALLKPLHASIASIKGDIANLRDFYNEHIELFHKIFGNYEVLLSSNVTLDVSQLQSFIDKKTRKKPKGAELQNKKSGKKHNGD